MHYMDELEMFSFDRLPDVRYTPAHGRDVEGVLLNGR